MSVYSRAQSRYTFPCSVTKRAKCIALPPSSLAGMCWDGKLSWMLRGWFLKGDLKIGLSPANPRRVSIHACMHACMHPHYSHECVRARECSVDDMLFEMLFCACLLAYLRVCVTIRAVTMRQGPMLRKSGIRCCGVEEL